ncbi:MAG TPA: DNA helicase RecQ [Anaerolineae bacterium]|nr:DNA helicase RecQ [Anaerolineae bacterium]
MNNQSALNVLNNVFGYDAFRPKQSQVITNILAGNDTLLILPTGGGKSLCYQLPALLLDGLTVVVSPLIALMQDQVTQMVQLGIAATYLNSTLDGMSYNYIMDQVREGEVKLLYLAPETLLKPNILQLLSDSNLKLIAIDEAHCISSWGHDFRPEYRQLVPVRQQFPDAVCMALTATATERVQQDIRQQLAFRAADTFIGSFDRPNLYIDIQPKSGVLQQVLAFLDDKRGQSGIIYAGSRKDVDAMAQRLKEHGYNALPYHAGLDSNTRRQNQTAFIRDDVQIMVATIAFGMGIDKPDVRFVLHIYLPKNIESYYQQIGRAGRDSLPANVRMFFNMGDVGRSQRFIEEGAPSERQGRHLLLQAFVDYVSSKQCRRKLLLGYFGEAYGKDNCGMCDNCTQEAAPQVDITLEAKKFLSCVYRTGQFFGASHVIDVLRGSQSQKVLAKRHDQLSTYNIGADLSKKEWTHLARQFVDQQLLKRDMRHGSLSITAKGMAMLKGQHKVMGERLPRVQVAAAGASWQAGEYDRALFALLRSKRKALADEANVPPYVIFADRALMEMATYFPQSRENFGRIYGVGTRKITQFADTFIPIIRAHCTEHNISEKPKLSSPPATNKPTTSKPPTLATSLHKARWQEVGEAFAQGASLVDLVANYRVKRGTIITNIAKFVEAGGDISAETLSLQSDLTPEDQAAVLEQFDALGDERLRPIWDAFDSRISYDELHLLRLVYRLQS